MDRARLDCCMELAARLHVAMDSRLRARNHLERPGRRVVCRANSECEKQESANAAGPDLYHQPRWRHCPRAGFSTLERLPAWLWLCRTGRSKSRQIRSRGCRYLENGYEEQQARIA